MQGLDISRRFFAEWGLPWLQREHPELVGRVAAGRMCGSDAIGADDEWSRDHDWGPRFRLWLTGPDYQKWGRKLDRDINAAAPSEFLGFAHHFFGRPKDGIVVESIGRFFEDHTRRREPPRTARGWFIPRRGHSLVDRESWLYFIRHGEIFHDPLGEFTARRRAFARRPMDVRLKVMQRQCTTLWYVGSYKFHHRLVHRTDPYAFHLAVSQTVEAAMKLALCLRDDYAPHWQWIHHAFERLPEAETLGPILDRFLAGGTPAECAAVSPEITTFFTRWLAEDGWVAAGCDSLQQAADEIRARISDRMIREMD